MTADCGNMMSHLCFVSLDIFRLVGITVLQNECKYSPVPSVTIPQKSVCPVNHHDGNRDEKTQESRCVMKQCRLDTCRDTYGTKEAGKLESDS